LAQAYKLCPICETPNHRNASVCSTCGATLARVQTIAGGDKAEPPAPTGYTYQYGETDLAEKNLRWRGATYLLSGLIVLSTLVCVGAVALVGINLFGSLSQTGAPLSLSSVPISSPLAITTNTPRPTLALATVTPAPPTPLPTPTDTPTPTQGPCIQQVQPNDDLYAIVARCGHRHYDAILSIVAELNDLDDPSRILPGQSIEVPWPTSTPDPNAIPTDESSSEADEENGAVALASSIQPGRVPGGGPPPTETLLPGVMWHTVQADENILSIAYFYGANLKILSELNPEVTFSQCDFGSASGGPNCLVQLYIGQRLRVPAPTPTPTLSPTPSGSETPTPTLTPTFNAPSPLSPSDRAFFRSSELVTLRWVTSGSLAAGQVYLIRVEDQMAKAVYTATTRELYFIVPEEWHNQDSIRHDFIWTVSVVDNDRPDAPYFTTEPRLFTWQGRGEDKK
jgi:hypothetical protein